MTDYTDDEIKLIRSLELLSIRDFAERAGLAESSIRTYRTRGNVPPPDVTIGTTPGWLASTVDPWIVDNVPGKGSRTDLREADRRTLLLALSVLARPGVSEVPSTHLQQGFKPDIPLDAVARRVREGADKLALGGDADQQELGLITRAYKRALSVLDEPRRAESFRLLGAAIRQHYGWPAEAEEQP